MPPMGRPRNEGSKDLPPGLFLYPGRDAYIKLGDMKPLTIKGVRTRAEALPLYWEFRRIYDAERSAKNTEALFAQIVTAAKGGDVTTVAAYAKNWREKHLPILLARSGEPLSKKTRVDYASIVRAQVEEHDVFKTLAISGARTKHLRAFLAQWIGSPHFYNYALSVSSRFFQQAVDEGLLEDNPAANVNRRPTPKRKVVVPMDHYLAITKKLEEWEARACDLIYLASHRPGDVLRLEDRPPSVRYELRRGRKVVVLGLKATKNKEAIDIYDDVEKNGGIEATLQWFREWKARQNFVGIHHVVVYPRYGSPMRRVIGRPLSVKYLSGRFRWATAQCGLKGKYQLRDLRKTGLNDEARKAGKATNKGAHKTQEMREYYVVDVIPQRARSTLAVLRR